MPGLVPLLSGLDFRRGLCADRRGRCRAVRVFPSTPLPPAVMPGTSPGMTREGRTENRKRPRNDLKEKISLDSGQVRDYISHSGEVGAAELPAPPFVAGTDNAGPGAFGISERAHADGNADGPVESAEIDIPARHPRGANVDPVAICLPDAYVDGERRCCDRMESTLCTLFNRHPSRRWVIELTTRFRFGFMRGRKREVNADEVS